MRNIVGLNKDELAVVFGGVDDVGGGSIVTNNSTATSGKEAAGAAAGLAVGTYFGLGMFVRGGANHPGKRVLQTFGVVIVGVAGAVLGLVGANIF